MRIALLSIAMLSLLAGCEVRSGLRSYSTCGASDSCSAFDDYCVDVGGAGMCSRTCFDDFDCPSRNGFGGFCRTLAAYPDRQPVCFQGCNNDGNCPAGTACSDFVCVPVVGGVSPNYPNYEVCADTSECDPTYSENCFQTDSAGRSMCTSTCNVDGDCLGRGAVRGACRSLPDFPGRSGVCFLACDGTTACPEFTACNGDVCVPNY